MAVPLAVKIAEAIIVGGAGIMMVADALSTLPTNSNDQSPQLQPQPGHDPHESEKRIEPEPATDGAGAMKGPPAWRGGPIYIDDSIREMVAAVEDAAEVSILPRGIQLKYKPEWTAAQRAAADAKIAALNEFKDLVKTPVENRSATQQSRYRRENSLAPEVDADHIVDLQLGGSDVKENLWALDKSVNRSLGAQIQAPLKEFETGERVGPITIGE